MNVYIDTCISILLQVFDSRLLCDYCGHRPIDHPASTPEAVEEKRQERRKREEVEKLNKAELKAKAAEKKALIAKQNYEARLRKVCFH